MTKPLISIIIPVYNVEAYLRQCLDSILKQSYENYEVLMVDDGSPDNSPAICDEYAGAIFNCNESQNENSRRTNQNGDPRIKVFHKENGGVSSARNLGLEYASGDWIWFVDADDYITDGALQILADATKLSCDTIFHGLVILDDATKTKTMVRQTHQPTETEEAFYYDKEIFLEHHFCYQNGMMLFSRDIITRAHLRFTSGIKMGEDLEFQYKYLLLCQKPVSIAHNLYYYRQREGSAIANPMTHVNNMNNCLTVAANLAEFVRKFNLQESEWFDRRIRTMIKSGLQSAERFSWDEASLVRRKLNEIINAYKTIGYNNVADRTIRIASLNMHLYIALLRLYYKLKGIKR